MLFSLYRGDCLDLLPKVVEDKSVNLILCDLPYDTTNCHWDSPIDLTRLWAEYKRVLAPGGCVVLFAAMPFTATLYNSNPKWYRDHLVADKNKCGSPGLAKIRPMRVHEDILIFSPAAYTYNPQMEVGEPYHRKSKNPAGYVGRRNDHGYGLKPRTEFHNDGTRYPKSIVNMRRDFSAQQQVHSAQKPVHTCNWLIRTYSNPGDVVLDNAMGSGTTGVACVEVGRRSFIGIDKDEDENGDPLGYIDISRARILHAQMQAFDEAMERDEL